MGKHNAPPVSQLSPNNQPVGFFILLQLSTLLFEQWKFVINRLNARETQKRRLGLSQPSFHPDKTLIKFDVVIRNSLCPHSEAPPRLFLLCNPRHPAHLSTSCTYPPDTCCRPCLRLALFCCSPCATPQLWGDVRIRQVLANRYQIIPSNLYRENHISKYSLFYCGLCR